MAQRMLANFSGLFGNISQPAANSMETAHGYYREEMAPNDDRDRRGSHDQGSQRLEPEERDEAQEREDLLDQHVAYYLKHHPEVHQKHRISRVRPGVYNFNGREISVEWHYAEDPDQQGYLVAIDGVLRQPFADYMEENEKGIEYDERRLGKSSLSLIPKGKRLSFGDTNKVYSRLEAMKVAKEQALVREKAADFVKDGMPVPQHELMTKYKKTISVKLGERRQKRPAAEAPLPEALQVHAHVQAESPVAVPPAETPVLWEPPLSAAAPPAPTPAATSPPRAPVSPAKGNRTHGAPKYCAAHCKTEQRKKTKPQNKACTACQTVIQTNYKEFTLCPTCSEKDHRCMCCGAAAIGSSPEPQAREAPSSPVHARASQQQHTKSPASATQQQPQSPMNLFGMPDLLNSAVKPMPITEVGSGLFNGGGIMSAWHGSTPNQAPTTQMMTPQKNNGFVSSGANNAYVPSNANNAYVPNNAFASQNPMASQNPYASQNGFTSYNPIAPQSAMPPIVDMRYMN